MKTIKIKTGKQLRRLVESGMQEADAPKRNRSRGKAISSIVNKLSLKIVDSLKEEIAKETGAEVGETYSVYDVEEVLENVMIEPIEQIFLDKVLEASYDLMDATKKALIRGSSKLR